MTYPELLVPLSVTLIIPIGVYEERISKSVVRSGADKVYLLKSTDQSFNQIIGQVTSSMLERFKSIVAIEEFDTVDFTEIIDIYRALTKAITAERIMNPGSRILIDVTSTTKEAVIVASTIAQQEKLQLTYVPRSSKLTPEQIEERYFTKTGIESEREQFGEERILWEFPETKWKPLNEDEINILQAIHKNSGYDSVNDLVQDIKSNERSDRYWIRTLHQLKGRKYVSLDDTGREKILNLTAAGMGTILGIMEGREYAKLAKYGNLKAGSLERDLMHS